MHETAFKKKGGGIHLYNLYCFSQVLKLGIKTKYMSNFTKMLLNSAILNVIFKQITFCNLKPKGNILPIVF